MSDSGTTSLSVQELRKRLENNQSPEVEKRPKPTGNKPNPGKKPQIGSKPVSGSKPPVIKANEINKIRLKPTGSLENLTEISSETDKVEQNKGAKPAKKWPTVNVSNGNNDQKDKCNLKNISNEKDNNDEKDDKVEKAESNTVKPKSFLHGGQAFKSTTPVDRPPRESPEPPQVSPPPIPNTLPPSRDQPKSSDSNNNDNNKRQSENKVFIVRGNKQYEVLTLEEFDASKPPRIPKAPRNVNLSLYLVAIPNEEIPAFEQEEYADVDIPTTNYKSIQLTQQPSVNETSTDDTYGDIEIETEEYGDVFTDSSVQPSSEIDLNEKKRLEKEAKEKERLAKEEEKRKKKEEDQKRKEADKKKNDELKAQKKVNEIYEKFKLDGHVDSLHKATIKKNVRKGLFGTNKDNLAVNAYDVVEIIRMDGNPPGKWLARFQGSYGYVDSDNVYVDQESLKGQFCQNSVPEQFEQETYEPVDSPPNAWDPSNAEIQQPEDVYDEIG